MLMGGSAEHVAARWDSPRALILNNTMAWAVQPLVEVLTLEELLERLAVLRDGVEEMCDFYEALWGGLDERHQGLLRVMGDGDLLQLELLRAEE